MGIPKEKEEEISKIVLTIMENFSDPVVFPLSLIPPPSSSAAEPVATINGEKGETSRKRGRPYERGTEQLRRSESLQYERGRRSKMGQMFTQLQSIVPSLIMKKVLQPRKDYHDVAAENALVENNVSTETPVNEVHTIHMSPGPRADVDNQNKEQQHETKEVKTKPSEVEMHNLMLVAAVLIATVTYQAGLSPPTTIWNDGVNHSRKCKLKMNFLLKGPTDQCQRFYFFMIFNTGGFLLATAVMLWITWSSSNKAIKLLGTSILMLLANYTGLLLFLSPDPRTQGIYLLSLPLVAWFYCNDLAIRSLLKLWKKRVKRQPC